MNDPLGRFGSLRPARVRRIARDNACDGVVLPDDPLVQLSSSIRSRRAVSSSVSL